MEILGVIASLLGIAAEAKAADDQKNLGYANLYETKRSNRQKEHLAESSRQDAYGNVVSYDPQLGWQINLSPNTKRILDAQQSEQLSSLTEDAARNRAQARRKEGRSISADEEFNRVFNEFKYRPQKTQSQYVADSVDDALRSRRKASDEVGAVVNRQLLRTGRGSELPQIFKSARDAEADEFDKVFSDAKRRGMQDYLTFEGNNNNMFQKELSFLQGIADDTTQLPQRFGNDNERLSNESDQALATLLQVLGQNDASRQSATSTLMQALGNTPNFAPLASALSKVGSSFAGMGGKATGAVDYVSPNGAPIPRPYEEGILARTLAANAF